MRCQYVRPELLRIDPVAVAQRPVASERIDFSERPKTLDVGSGRWNGGGLIDDAEVELAFALEDHAQSSQHLIVRHHMVSLGHDLLRARKQALIDYGRDNLFTAHPAILRIFYTLLPKKPGRAVVHVISNIVLILEDVVDFMVGPRPRAVVGYVCTVELTGDFSVRLSLNHKLMEYPPDDRGLFRRTKPEQHAICL